MNSSYLNDYYRILTKALRPKTVLPFSCYVHLQAQSRIIPYVGMGHEFTDAKASKLSQFGYENVYILIADKPRYFSYLDEFLKTDEGSNTLKELIESSGGIEKVHGLPTAEEFSLTVLNDLPKEEVETIRVVGGEVAENQVQVIERTAREIQEKIEVTGSFSDDEKKVLSDCTEVLNQELIRIEGQSESNQPEDSTLVIKEATLKIDQQVLVVKQIAQNKNDKTRIYLEGFSARIESAKDQLLSYALKKSAEGDRAAQLRDLRHEIDEIRIAATVDTKQIIKSALQTVIEEVHPGGIALPQTDSRELLDAQNKVKALEEELEKAKLKVSKQNILIGKIAGEVANTKEAMAEAKQTWAYYNANTHLRADDAAKLKAKELTLNLDEVTRKAEVSVIELTKVQTLSGEMLGQLNVNEIQKETAKKELAVESQPKITPVAPPPEEKQEIEVLRCQLEEAQTQIAESEKRIVELIKIGSENEMYVGEIEKSLDERQKKIVTLEDKVGTLELKKSKFEDAIREHDRVNHRNRAEIEIRDGQIQDLKQKLEIMKKELMVYTQNKQNLPEDLKKLPESFTGVIAQKDRLIDELQTGINENYETIRDLKKAKANLEANAEAEAKHVKAMAEEIENMKGKHNELRNSEQALQTKLGVVSKSLEGMRKAVTRLTEVSESLRADRVENMRKTSEALGSFKKAINQSTGLNKTLSVQKEKYEAVLKENEALKAQNHENLKQLTQVLNSSRQSGSDRKKYEAKIRELETTNFKLDFESLKKESEQKVKNLKEENRELKAELAVEQGKTRQLATQLKGLVKKTG